MDRIQLLEQQLFALKKAQVYIAESFKDRAVDGKTTQMMLGSIIQILETISVEIKELKAINDIK